MTVLLVTGSRKGHPHVRDVLDRYAAKYGLPEVLIAGDNAYADRLTVDHAALLWALELDVFFVTYGAEWTRGVAAGPRRNLFMAMLASKWDSANGAHCIGFPVGDSHGTLGCMEHAGHWWLQVFEVDIAGRVRRVPSPHR